VTLGLSTFWVERDLTCLSSQNSIVIGACRTAASSAALQPVEQRLRATVRFWAGLIP
jgi:hypothetical protein